uniref:SHG n=1 Tax=Littorina littorea TaxID=31216 RepID=Q8N0N1_LITLI|nr:SHG [Littorina littorea]
MGTVLKVVEFVESHRNLLDDLGNMVQNVTHVTLDKIDGLAKQFLDNPSEELLTKMIAYLQAHHIIQNNIMQFLEKNGAGLVSMGLQDLLTSHKRDTDLLSQVTQVGSKLADSFGPIVSSLKGLISGLGSQLLGFFKNLLPNADQLVAAFQPHLSALQEHGNNLLDTAKGALDAVKDAVGDILQETMKQSAPHVNGILGPHRQRCAEHVRHHPCPLIASLLVT